MPRRSIRLFVLAALVLPGVGLVIAACGGDEEPVVTAAAAATDTQTPAAANTAVAPAAAAPVRAAPTPAATAAAAAAAAAAEQSADEERPSAGGGATVQVQRPSATAATTSDGTYTVQAGDTLGDIAFRFGTTAAVLQDINQLDNPDLLQVGDVLILPGGEPEEEEDTVAEEDDGDEAATDETGEESDGEDGEDGDDATAEDATAEDATAEDEAGTDEAGEEGDDPAEDDPAEDDAAEDAPAEDDTPPTPVPAAPTGLSPNGIPQPASDVTLEDVPVRPAALAAFATTALPWLQDRTAVDEIVDLFIAWSMPPVPRGDRFHLVDTDADGLFSLVAIFTDPGPAQHGSLTDANLVIYDPAPEQPTRWRQAFDHNLAYGGGQDFFVMTVVDLTGDGRRDIMYGETACGANTCTTIVRVLVRDGDGYRNAAVDIAVPTATSFGFDDVTGDGVADLTIEGGTFGSVGAGPVRPFQFVYSAVGGNFAEIARVGLPTSYLVWIIADGNTAFDAGDYVGALALYGLAASDGSLDEFVPGAGPELMALAQLRASITQLRLGDATAATSLAQMSSAGGGLIGALGTAYLSAIIAQPEPAIGCAALNDALTPRVAEWDAFWQQFGFGLPPFLSQQLCPF